MMGTVQTTVLFENMLASSGNEVSRQLSPVAETSCE